MNGDELDRRRWPDGAIRAWWEAPDGLKLRKMDWPQLRPEAARGSLLFAGGRADLPNEIVFRAGLVFRIPMPGEPGS